jgi:hypothetical protein
MSDLGLLSQQYKERAGLARRLRQWAVQVRRAYHSLPVPEIDGEPDLAIALTKLAHVARFLEDVIGLEDEGTWPRRWLVNPALPTVVVDRLREAHALDRPLYIKQLARLAEHLENGTDALTGRDLNLLDDIVLAAGADANAVFRRLMRWA